MFFKINYFAIIMLGAIGVVSCNAFPNIIAQTNDTANTFVIESQEYLFIIHLIGILHHRNIQGYYLKILPP